MSEDEAARTAAVTPNTEVRIMAETTLTQGNRRPVMFLVRGERGGDVSARFIGRATYESDNPDVATIAAEAELLAGKLVSGSALGTANVTATFTDDDGSIVTAVVTVTVSATPPPPREAAVGVEVTIGDEEPIPPQ